MAELDESRDATGVTFEHALDCAVCQIANPAGNTVRNGLAPDGVAKEDALHATPHNHAAPQCSGIGRIGHVSRARYPEAVANRRAAEAARRPCPENLVYAVATGSDAFSTKRSGGVDPSSRTPSTQTPESAITAPPIISVVTIGENRAGFRVS